MKLLSTLLIIVASAFNTEAASQNLNTKAVASGTTHSLALRSDGTAWAFGTSTSSALGLGATDSTAVPTRISQLSNIVAISVSQTHSLAVDAQGSVWAWGTNTWGQLGTGNTNTVNVPTKMNAVTNAIAVSAGPFHSLVLLSDGRVMGCGYNGNSSLGDGSTTSRLSPVATTILTNAVEVTAGANHSVARSADGRVWIWGSNAANQLGLAGYSSTNRPAQLALTTVSGIAAGSSHSLAVLTNGQVYAWGTNNFGQLGFAVALATTNVPAAVPGLTSVRKVSASSSSSSAILQDGAVSIWGFNNLTTTGWSGSIAPAQALTADEVFVNLSQGNGHVLAVTKNGEVWGRGSDSSGQQGDGYISATSYPQYDPNHLSFRFAPFPKPQIAGQSRGELGQQTYTSRVLPLDFQSVVALPATGAELYSYPDKTPWFLRIAKSTAHHAKSLTGGTPSRFPVENPLAAFGRESGASRLYTGQAYSVGMFGGLFDENQSETNVIRISAYSRSSFSNGTETGVSPTATWTIGLPKRFSGANWGNFVANGLYLENEQNGLKTRVEFVEGDPDSKTWGMDWLRSTNNTPLVAANAVLAGLRLTHIGTATNTLYKVEYKGRVQTAINTLVPFAADGSGAWTWLPLYTLDFDQRPAWREQFLDTPHFAGIPLPPEYNGRSERELSGLLATPTSTFVLTNDAAYVTLDGSPELTTHPLLDQLVEDYGRDPLALSSYVINEIDLSDPIMLGEASQTSVRGAVSAPGVRRSAIGTYLEGQGSPTEQCALLVYLLRKAGVSAGYAFPTNDNLRLLDATLSKLWRIQVKGVVYTHSLPVLTNALVLTDYPWVVANIGTNTVHIFPWLKDYEIVEGENVYDFMPPNYDNAYKWVKAYSFGDTNILSLAPGENSPSVLWPKFIENVLRTNQLNSRVTLDRIGVRTFNRKRNFPTWAHLPKPNYLTNQSQICIVPTLTTSTNVNTFLAGIMDKIKVTVFNTSVSPANQLLTTGEWLACDLNNRKLLVYPETTNSLGLWLAPRRPSATTTGNFSSATGASPHPQSLNTAFSQNVSLIVQIQYTRRSAGLTSPGSYFPVLESKAITNQVSCRYGDVAAVCFKYGSVSQSMLRMHAEDYWQLERIRATNQTFKPSLRDNEGTAAMLLGMGYLQAESDFFNLNNSLHKLTSMTWFGTGLGVIGRVGTTNIQAKVDMPFSGILAVGNGSLHPATWDSHLAVIENAMHMWIAGGSALEHRIIQTTFQDNDAISTVRLLQLAMERATNGVAAPLELNRQNYVALGDATYSGYGLTKLKDQDSSIWTSIADAFNEPNGYSVRVLITPGPVTNQTGSYKGMGALVLTTTRRSALISGNMIPLNGGWGSRLPTTSLDNLPSGPQLSYGLQLKNQGIAFYYNNQGNVVRLPTISANMAVNLGTASDNTFTTPAQEQSAFQVSLSYNLGPGNAKTSLRIGEDTGIIGQAIADIRQVGGYVLDPVSVITGAFYTDTVDLTLPGPFPLQLRRNYTSHNLADNQFGYGWKMNFMPFLVVIPNGANPPLIQAADPDGAVILYRSTAANTWTVSAADNPTLCNNGTLGVGGTANAFNGRIEKDTVNNIYILFGPDGSKRTFKETSYPLTSGANQLNRQRPYLVKWEDHSGNFHVFLYGTDASQNDYGQVRRIESSNGNALGFKYDFFGRIIEAFTLDGRRITYEYDFYGDLVSVQLPDASKWTYEYEKYSFTTNSATYTDSMHLIKRELKPDGRVLENAYDNLRRVVTQAASVGKSGVLVTNAYFAYTNNFHLTNLFVTGSTHVRDVFGNPTVYYYTNSLIGRIVDPLNQTMTQDWFESTETGKTGYYPRSLELSTDKRGLQKFLQYDVRGNITKQILKGDLTGNGSSTETATNDAVFTSQNMPQSVTDPIGRTTTFYYEDGANLYKLTRVVQSASGTPLATNKFSYTNVSEIFTVGGVSRTNQVFALKSEEVRADVATNRWTYNSRGYPISSTRIAKNGEDPANLDPNVTLTLSYNQRGQLYEQTDAAGRKIRFDFDASGRMLWRESLDESGNAVAREHFYYNRNGELEWYDGPASEPEDYVHYDYDGAGRKIEETRWQAAARLDGAGVELKSGDALYSSTFFDYDAFGNLVRTINPRGTVTTNRYDAIGQLLVREALKADGSVATRDQFLYEPGGLVKVQTNALGAIARIGYTSLGAPFIKTNFDGSISQWRYDLAARTTKEILRNGSYWQTTYDDANRRITKVFKDSGNTSLATNITELDRRGNIVRTFDVMGNGFTNVFDGLDRLRASFGPSISTDLGTNAPPNPGGSPPPPVQQVTTVYYDAVGIVTTNVNAFGEKVVETRDILGRQTKREIFNSSAQSIRLTTTAWFTNHHGAAITEGSGNDAITRYALTDNEGRNVLSAGYPSQFVMEYSVNDFDPAGNLLSSSRLANNRGAITRHTIQTNAFDELNRLTVRSEKDNAISLFFYDALGNVTNRVNPGGLIWAAAYNVAGQMVKNWNVGTNGTMVRSNNFSYYNSGNWIGLPSVSTDARGVSGTITYDGWLRPATKVYTGATAEQKMTNTFAFDARGLLTNIVERFETENTSPTVTIHRSYDAYGNLVSESSHLGTNIHSSAGLGWNSGGRRHSVGVDGHVLSFSWRADGLLSGVGANNGVDAAYGYSSAGLLNSRVVENRTMTVTARDGLGRIFGRTTTINGSNRLVESLGWTDDGLLGAETLVRSGGPSDGNFTDNRSYAYAPLTRRLSQEKLNLNSSTLWTTQFQYDKGAASGAGILTTIADPQAGGAAWNADVDEFRRLKQETNNVVRRFAYGRVNASNQIASVSVYLDNKPLPVTTVGTPQSAWPLQWWAYLELLPGAHTLQARATHASGTFVTNSTLTFTNNAIDQTTLSYFSEGQLTQRVWRSTSGVINRTQNLVWDGKGRLMKITERDASTNGYDWTATYDAFGRRLRTVTSRVVNGTNLTAQPTIAKSYFDPSVEFLEIAVDVNGKKSRKVYGPDLNGRYGALQGVGGLEAIVEGPGVTYLPFVDALGNVLGHYDQTHGTNGWHSSRPTGYGAIPEFRPLSVGESPNLSAAVAWRGKSPDLSGFYWIGARYYDPVSGQFISCDPLGHDADPSLYAFANGDPVNYFDPTGRIGVNMGINIGNDVKRGNDNFWFPIHSAGDSALNAIQDPIGAVQSAYEGITSFLGQAISDPLGTASRLWDSFTSNFDDPDKASQMMGSLTLAAMPVPPVATVIKNLDRLTPDVPNMPNPPDAPSVPSTGNGGQTIYRAVTSSELNSIQDTGRLSVVPGSSTPLPGVEGKWFYGSLDDVQDWAERAVVRDGGPLTIIETTIPDFVNPAHAQPWVDGIKNPALFFDLQDLNAPINILPGTIE